MTAQALRGVVAPAHRAALASSRGNRVTLLSGARATYDSLEAAIDAAQARAWLSIYAFRPDESGRPILSALGRAAARGVDVRLVVDAFGSRGLGAALSELAARGGRPAVLRVMPRPGGRWPRPDARNHKKLAAFDSTVGFVGGVNVGDQFLPWRDLHVRVVGPAARDLEAAILTDYVQARGARDAQARGERSARPDTSTNGSAPHAIEEADGGSKFDVVTSRAPGAIHSVVQDLLAGARERVRLTTPYFVPSKALLGALLSAARSGVRVEVLTPRRSNWPMANWAGRGLFPALLEAGVHVMEHHDVMLHAKAMVIDGERAAIGSPNFDARSFHINGEVLCVVHDRALVAGIERALDEDGAGARALDLPRFRRRPPWQRIIERGAGLFADWL